MQKKILIQILIGSLLLNACNNNVGGNNRPATTNFNQHNNTTLMAEESNSPVSAKYKLAQSVVESGDMLLYVDNNSESDPVIPPPLYYISASNGLLTLNGQLAQISLDMNDDRTKLITYIKQILPSMSTMKSPDGIIYQPDGRSAISYNQLTQQLRWLEFTNDTTFGEYQLDLTTAQVKLLQQGAMENDYTKVYREVSYALSPISGIDLISLRYSSKGINEDGETKDAIVEQSYQAANDLQLENENNLSTSLAPPLDSNAYINAEYNFTDKANSETANIIRQAYPDARLGQINMVENGGTQNAFTYIVPIIIGIVLGAFPILVRDGANNESLKRIKDMLAKDHELAPENTRKISSAVSENLVSLGKEEIVEEDGIFLKIQETENVDFFVREFKANDVDVSLRLEAKKEVGNDHTVISIKISGQDPVKEYIGSCLEENAAGPKKSKARGSDPFNSKISEIKVTFKKSLDSTEFNAYKDYIKGIFKKAIREKVNLPISTIQRLFRARVSDRYYNPKEMIRLCDEFINKIKQKFSNPVGIILVSDTENLTINFDNKTDSQELQNAILHVAELYNYSNKTNDGSAQIAENDQKKPILKFANKEAKENFKQFAIEYFEDFKSALSYSTTGYYTGGAIIAADVAASLIFHKTIKSWVTGCNGYFCDYAYLQNSESVPSENSGNRVILNGVVQANQKFAAGGKDYELRILQIFHPGSCSELSKQLNNGNEKGVVIGRNRDNKLSLISDINNNFCNYFGIPLDRFITTVQ